MAIHKREKHVFNVALAKMIALESILHPESTRLGRYSVYHIFTVFLILVLSLTSVMLCINGVYTWADHKVDTVLAFGYAEAYFFMCYKLSIVVYRHRDLWDCLSITRFNFTSHGCQDIRLLEVWKNRSIWFTNLYAVVAFTTLVLYGSIPLIFRNQTVLRKTVDGSDENYRINILNLYAFVSAETYNSHFSTMYLVEMLCPSVFVYTSIIYDTLFIMLAIALLCQLQIVNRALTTFKPTRITKNQSSNNTDGNIELEAFNEHCTTYERVKTIIQDHQAVIKNLEKCFNLFRPIILLQIVVSSNSIIVIWLTILKQLMKETLQAYMGSTILKVFFVIPLVLSQLFIPCYIFDKLHDQKDSIIFALYSCNWTKMDIKSKKLVMLAMQLNNAHKRKLKFSKLKVVSLEMFLGTLRICYSVLSVLLK